jgi:hypothetical protein
LNDKTLPLKRRALLQAGLAALNHGHTGNTK